MVNGTKRWNDSLVVSSAAFLRLCIIDFNASSRWSNVVEFDIFRRFGFSRARMVRSMETVQHCHITMHLHSGKKANDAQSRPSYQARGRRC